MGRGLLREKTDAEWEVFGANDPYFGVITHEKYRRDRLDDGALADFFKSGEQHVAHLFDTIHRHVDPEFTPQRALDFGCGVGRILIPMSKLCSETVGMDVSASMLHEAQANCTARGAKNVTLVLADDALSGARGEFDLVHSYIVLQHVPPDRGTRIFRKLTDRVRRGGVGVLHVTYDVPAPRSLRVSLSRIPFVRLPYNALRGRTPSPRMQMNSYDLNELIAILHSSGATRVHAELTDHGGPKGALLYFRRD